jgi:tetratricopeptide (TPR) repeat protein
MGRREEGNAEMQAYLALEAEARAEEQRLREIAALDRDAMAAFLEERHEEAIGLYRRAIDSHPEVALFYFKLGLAQSKLGRHRDAVETFRMLIELGLSDDFLVHKNLAAAYAMLGDSEASVRHERIYLEKRNAEMETGPED